ncbi:unnamed protein product [Effrenium voratum]|nr:unnamed protein product [Effrenium voratum]
MAWWASARESPTAQKLRSLLQAGGVAFYDAECHFVKAPMVALVAVGGIPVRTSGDSLDLLLGELAIPVPLESIRSALKSQMGMTAMFSYLNRRGLEPEEMWGVASRLADDFALVGLATCTDAWPRCQSWATFQLAAY